METKQLQQVTTLLNQKLDEIYDAVRSYPGEEKHDLLDSCVRSLFSSVIVGIYRMTDDLAAQKYAMEVALECYKNAEDFCMGTAITEDPCPKCGSLITSECNFCPICGEKLNGVTDQSKA